jgi:Lar family restriction alleviation protein
LLRKEKNMENELKKCPFCESDDVILAGTYADDETMDDLMGYQGYCNDCEAQGPAAKTEIAATILWNNRPFEK